MSFALDEHDNVAVSESLVAFKRLRAEIRELNQAEPFPPEFDETINNSVSFTSVLDL
jgi:hypothetical protein